MSSEELAYLFPDEEVVPYYSSQTPDSIAPLTKQSVVSEAIVIDDLYDHYYHTLQEGEGPNPDCFIVAKECLALCSIMPLVDNQLKVEAILDPGCQIIAMSEDVCHELALQSHYSPSYAVSEQIHRPIAWLSTHIIAFLIGTLTFYMQVHIIDILLG
jgi:hypothetical protein